METSIKIFIGIVVIVAVFSSIYQAITFEPDVRCMDGVLYEKEFDGDFEVIRGFNGLPKPCENGANYE